MNALHVFAAEAMVVGNKQIDARRRCARELKCIWSLDRAIQAKAVTAELYTGPWANVGSPEQLDELNAPA